MKALLFITAIIFTIAFISILLYYNAHPEDWKERNMDYDD